MSFQWQEYSKDDYSDKVALAIAHALNEVIAQKGEARVHVSGGKSPIEIFKKLSSCDVAWERVRVSLVDERLVPSQHADSNTALVCQYLLQNKAVSAHFAPLVSDSILLDSSYQDEAQQDQALLDFALGHYAQPDIVVLGMGLDGHTASIFPDSPMLQDALCTQQNLLITSSVSAPHKRMSMSLHAISNTPHVFLSIQGLEKKAVFDTAAIKQDERFPISYILHSAKVVCHVCYAQ